MKGGINRNAESLLFAWQNVASAAPVSQKDVDVAVRAEIALCHSDIPRVDLASTFSSFPKEEQNEVEKAD
jgi:hypothetical protein